MQPEPRPNPLFEIINPLIQLAKSAWRKTAALNELARCDRSELAGIAQDLGFSAADLCLLATRDKRAADLLYRRLESLRLDPTGINPAVMRDLQRCCSNCNSKQLCVHELEDKPVAASWPSYCPNEHTLSAISRTKSAE
jgi:hypothetical protein